MSNTKTEAQRLADRTTPYHGPHAQAMARELLRLDAENQQLRAQLAKAVAEEREACAKVCEDFMRLTLDAQLGESSDLHNVMLRQIANLGHGELAAAIRARSNT